MIKFILQYKKIASSTVLFTIATGLPLMAEKLFLNPLLLKYMGKDNFGCFVISLGLILMFVTVPAFSYRVVYIREHAHYQGEKKDLFFRSSLFSVIFILLILLILLYLLASPLGKLFSINAIGVEKYTKQLIPYGLLFGIYLVMQSYFRAQLRYGKLLILSIGNIITILIVAFVACFIGIQWIGLWYILIPAGSVLTACIFAKKAFFSLPLWKKDYLLSYAKIVPYFAGVSLLNIIQSYVARLYLGATVSSEQVTYFFAANSIALVFLQIPEIIGRVAFSYISRYKTLNDMKISQFKHYLFIAISCTPLIGLTGWLLGPLTLRLLFPSIADKSQDIFLTIIIGTAFLAPQSLLVAIVQKFSRPFVTSVIYSITVGINLLFLAILAQRYGAMGAAIASAVSYTISGILYVFLCLCLYKKQKKLKFK